MAKIEARPDSGTSMESEEKQSERQMRYRAEEIVRESFRSSSQYIKLIEQTMLALKKLQEDVDSQIRRE